MKRDNRKLTVILWGIVFLLVGAIILYLFTLTGMSISEVLAYKDYWLSIGVADGLIVIAYLLMYRVDAQNIALKENDLENTEWLTVKRIKKLKEFNVSEWDGEENEKDGIVISAEKKKGGVEIISTSQLHALIVGTTGSGKTTGFVDQNIAILSQSQGKPTLVITDPKKELYEKHHSSLKARGYDISVLDLRQPYTSAKWNPMNVLIRRIRMIKEFKSGFEAKDGKYCAGGITYLSYEDAMARKQELNDEIFENAMDLIYTLCPVKNKDQPTWEEGARNLIFGFVLAMCEDCIAGKIEEKQLLLFNVYHNITKYCSEDTTALKKYLLEGRDEFSKVRGLVNTVLITSDKTLTSYLSEVNAYMQQLSDDGILSLTSEDELDIVNADEQPTAIFVIVPDERFTRHRFVTLFITQLYKELVEKANLNLRKGEKNEAILKRNAYFILDEFANLPKFENIEGMVTVARSRGIRFLFVLQSFSQLNAKYGRDIADIIKTNCNVKLFIGSDDMETRKEFSELCGQKKIKSFSVNTSAENPASSNTGASNQPLITVGMLERLNGDKKGDAIVSVRGYEPIWSHFTPSYELKEVYFDGGNVAEEERKATLFEKKKVVFDIMGGVKPADADTDEEEKIEQIDRRDEKEMVKGVENVKDLDRQWDEIADGIRRKIEQFSTYLKGKDEAMIRSASLDNIVPLLLSLMSEYNRTIAQKMQRLADEISMEEQKLLAIQTEAKERNSTGG